MIASQGIPVVRSSKKTQTAHLSKESQEIQNLVFCGAENSLRRAEKSCQHRSHPLLKRGIKCIRDSRGLKAADLNGVPTR